MNALMKIGPIGLMSLLVFCTWLIYRLQANEDTRGPTALALIILARALNPIVDGFAFSLQTSSILGQLNSVMSYLLLSLALFEIVLIKSRDSWRRIDWLILGSIAFLAIYHLAWLLIIRGTLISSDFLFFIQIALLIFLRATVRDLRYLPQVGICLVALLIIISFTGYQNPFYPYKQTDYGLGGPYSNFLWHWFGLSERFRGPYQHPNSLGVQVVFLSTLAMLRFNWISKISIAGSFVLLGLAASRTSLVALTFALVVQAYFGVSNRADSKKMGNKQTGTSTPKVRKRSSVKIMAGILSLLSALALLRSVIGENLTFSGRTLGIIEVYSETADSRILGRGPAVENLVENSIVSLLSQYGFVGILLVLVPVLVMINKSFQVRGAERASLACIGALAIPASLGESLFGGLYSDMGALYLILALILTRSEKTEVSVQTKVHII